MARQSPGDAGYWSWKKKGAPESLPQEKLDGGSTINRLNYRNPLPSAYWSANSGLRCLDKTNQQVMDEGYTHHIPRLMVLANIATLLEVDPREITDWFWASFIDAYEWVVEPNALAMGTFATGEILSTKPYVCGSGYINKMSDHCASCSFHPKKNCPITRWYWAYLSRHSDEFKNNHRMKMILASLRRRSEDQKNTDRHYFEVAKQLMNSGQQLTPSSFDTDEQTVS